MFVFGDITKLQKRDSIVEIENNPKPIYVKDKAFWELFAEFQTAPCDREELRKWTTNPQAVERDY